MSQFPFEKSSDANLQDQNDMLFTHEDLWYFKTREGENIGPFRYRSEAQSNLEQFLANLEQRLK